MGKPKTARKKPSKRKSDKKNKPPKKHTRRLAGTIVAPFIRRLANPLRRGSGMVAPEGDPVGEMSEHPHRAIGYVGEMHGNVREPTTAIFSPRTMPSTPTSVGHDLDNPHYTTIFVDTRGRGIKKKRKPKKKRKSNKKNRKSKKKRKSKKNRKSRKKRRSRTARGKRTGKSRGKIFPQQRHEQLIPNPLNNDNEETRPAAHVGAVDHNVVGAVDHNDVGVTFLQHQPQPQRTISRRRSRSRSRGRVRPVSLTSRNLKDALFGKTATIGVERR